MAVYNYSIIDNLSSNENGGISFNTVENASLKLGKIVNNTSVLGGGMTIY